MRTVLLSLILLFLLNACKKTSSDATNDCTNVMCTADFRSIQVCLVDSNPAPQLADSTRVFYPDGSFKTNKKDDGYPGPACYVVESDS